MAQRPADFSDGEPGRGAGIAGRPRNPGRNPGRWESGVGAAAGGRPAAGRYIAIARPVDSRLSTPDSRFPIPDSREVIDTHAYIGSHPFRHLPHPDPGVLVTVLEREG